MPTGGRWAVGGGRWGRGVWASRAQGEKYTRGYVRARVELGAREDASECAACSDDGARGSVLFFNLFSRPVFSFLYACTILYRQTKWSSSSDDRAVKLLVLRWHDVAEIVIETVASVFRVLLSDFCKALTVANIFLTRKTYQLCMDITRRNTHENKFGQEGSILTHSPVQYDTK